MLNNRPSLSPPDRSFVDLGDITLHYTTHGHGTPLLLIHGGWGLAVNGFEFQTRTLADEFQLDRARSTRLRPIDARRSASTRTFTGSMRRICCDFIDALKIDRLVGVGPQRRRGDRGHHGDSRATIGSAASSLKAAICIAANTTPIIRWTRFCLTQR